MFASMEHSGRMLNSHLLTCTVGTQTLVAVATAAVVVAAVVAGKEIDEHLVKKLFENGKFDFVIIFFF